MTREQILIKALEEIAENPRDGECLNCGAYIFEEDEPTCCEDPCMSDRDVLDFVDALDEILLTARDALKAVRSME